MHRDKQEVIRLTGIKLAELCKAQLGSGYVWGGLGYILNQSRLDQLTALYPNHYTAAYQTKARALFGKKVYDCIGIIKHFLWGNAGDGVLRYYGTNGIPDTTANGMLEFCKAKGLDTGPMETLPELPGLMVHQNGHTGVYIGNGRVVEARGIDYGVVETDVRARGWKTWAKLPNVTYQASTADYIHVEAYPLSDYSFGIHRASVTPDRAPLGKVLSWAQAAYQQNNYLEGVINASQFSGNRPIGTVLESGKVVANGGNGWGFGLDKSGEVHFDRIFKESAQVPWQDMISAYPILVFRGQPQTIDTGVALFKDRHPRSAVALRGNEILFVTIDGRQVGRPGMTLTELRDYLVSIGCTEAINLDGGASSIQLRDRSGNGSFAVVNHPLEHRDVYNVIAAYRKPKPEPTPPPPPGKSISWEELVERLKAEGIENITL
jgi:hypothetical protein